MDIFSAYEVSDDAVTNGIWCDLIVAGSKIGAIRVRPSDPDLNHEYRKALGESGVAMLKLKQDKGTIPDEDTERMMIACMASTILTDWELFGPDEKPIKFSEKKAVELLTKLPKFRKAVNDAAKNWTHYRKELHGDAVKS